MAFPGEVLLRVASVVVIPLVTCMLATSMAYVGLAAARRMCLWALGFFIASKVLALAVAFALALTLNPGDPGLRIDLPEVPPIRGKAQYVDILLDIARNVIPSNLMESFIFTPYTDVKSNTSEEGDGGSVEGAVQYTTRRLTVPNYMGVIVFSLLFGAMLSSVSETNYTLLELFVAVTDAMLTIGNAIMWYFPIGICFLLTSQTLRTSEFISATRQLEAYLMSLVLALAIHATLTLPTLLLVFSRARYRSFFANMGITLITAFGTSSSNMTLVSAVSSLEEKVGLSPLVVRLFAPLGAMFNKDGTAIYMAINTVFFAQRNGYSITFLDVIVTSTVTMMVSSATASVPGQNELAIILNMQLLGLPSRSIGVSVLTDWIMDRLITVVNVLSDAVCCCIIDERCRTCMPEDMRTQMGMRDVAEDTKQAPHRTVAAYASSP
ncbi:neutral amino acid transporter B(0)-like [Haemaphysalis longicornis]